MNVLVACEFSGTVRDAFRAQGHNAWSCDVLSTDADPQWHIQGNVLDHLNRDWDLMIAHPPCTYLTNAGVRHLHDSIPSRNRAKASVSGSARWLAMWDGAEFFNTLAAAPIPRICIENPIPHKYSRALIGPYSQIVQPWQFGHGETKATCLWLHNLPFLHPTDIVEGREHKCHLASPGPLRWKVRSVTYQGIADAMVNQWGSL